MQLLLQIQFSNWKLIDLVGEYSKTCKNIDKCILSFVGVSKKWDWDCDSLVRHIDRIDETEKYMMLLQIKSIQPKKQSHSFIKSGF